MLLYRHSCLWQSPGCPGLMQMYPLCQLAAENGLQGITAQQEPHGHWLCAAGAGRAILTQV